MKISLLSPTCARGGAETQLKELAIRFARRGHQVLLTSMLPFEAFEHELRGAGVRTATLNMRQGQPSASAFLRLIRLLSEFEPHVLHSHMYAAIIAGRAARAALSATRIGRGVPVVIDTSHAPFEESQLRYLAYRLTARWSDAWTNVCQQGIDRHEREGAVASGAGLLTPNGIDTERFRPDLATRGLTRAELGIDDNTFLFISVGSFRDDKKDYPNLLRAAAQLPSSPSWRIAIAGTGVQLAQTRQMAADLGLADRVSFLGLRTDIPELLQAADAFVLPSWTEAMSIAVLEAASSALPCVVTDVGQNSAMLPPDGGAVVPPKDPRALAKAMDELLQSPADLRMTRGQAARAHVAGRYAFDTIADRWERLYAEALARAAARSRRSWRTSRRASRRCAD
jgi:glycosyltransferase involved in cell wall biosynthesis